MTFSLALYSESAHSITLYSPSEHVATMILEICLLLVTCKQKTTNIYI